MTVYEWLMSKPDIVVDFDKTIDDDYMEILKIQMDIGCNCYTTTNNDHTLTHFPITTTRTFYGNQIPYEDASMLHILDQMYQDMITVFNKIKYQNK